MQFPRIAVRHYSARKTVPPPPLPRKLSRAQGRDSRNPVRDLARFLPPTPAIRKIVAECTYDTCRYVDAIILCLHFGERTESARSGCLLSLFQSVVCPTVRNDPWFCVSFLFFVRVFACSFPASLRRPFRALGKFCLSRLAGRERGDRFEKKKKEQSISAIASSRCAWSLGKLRSSRVH